MSEHETLPNEDSILITPVEARVLGCLLEKERTTPENYPLSTNALTNACNQKSNRRPVMLLEEEAVRDTADSLRTKKLVMMFHGADARVPKFKHTLSNVFQLEKAEMAILCELLLRGPQTPGELRGRCERLHPFENASAVETTLTALLEYPVTPLVTLMPRQPGQKEQRYAHLLSGPPPEEAPSADAPPVQLASPTQERLDQLELEVSQLRHDMVAMRAELERFRQQFE